MAVLRALSAWLLWTLATPSVAPAYTVPGHLVGHASPLQTAREAPRPPAVVQAAALLEAGDTSAALGLLRAARAGDDRDPHIAFALGTLLARTAPFGETAFRRRMEAESLLDQAYEELRGDVDVLLEMAMLKRRQSMRVDARRLLERATESEEGRAANPRVLADAHFVLARILTEEMEDFERLVLMPAGWRRDGSPGTNEFVGSTRCPAGVAYFCLNYASPRAFNEQLAVAGRASDRGVDYPPRIEARYRAALSHVPDHPRAARGLLGLLHRQGRFEEMAEEAGRLLAVNPAEPYAHIFLGLAFQESLEWGAARAAFDDGLALLPPAERAPYDDVSFLLNEEDGASYGRLEAERAREYERILWAKSDPLFLIPENERLMEHVARVAYAELAFGDPERSRPGWSSDRGRVFIRYGMPDDIWMLRRDAGGAGIGGAAARAAASAGGRWIFWNYGLDVPSFVFRRQVGHSRVDFDFDANSRQYLRQVSESEATTTFESRAVHRWTELPAQVARFRGAVPGQVEVLAFLRADPDSFALPEGDSVQVGMFVFNRSYEDSARLSHAVKAGESGNVLFTFELPRGVFDYSLEALAAGSRVAARNRGTINSVPVPSEGVSTSDLVLAGGLAPRVDRPGGWRDFAIGASRDLVFEAEDDIHVYLEVYGLATGPTGVAGYMVEVTLRDAERRSVGARLLRSLGNLVGGGGGEAVVRYARTAEPVDGVVPEYFSISPGEAGEGAHRLVVAITDRATGASVTVERELTLRGPNGTR